MISLSHAPDLVLLLFDEDRLVETQHGPALALTPAEARNILALLPDLIDAARRGAPMCAPDPSAPTSAPDPSAPTSPLPGTISPIT